MQDDDKNLHFMLGELSGKLDGIGKAIETFSTTFIARSLADDKKFMEINLKIDRNKEETDTKLASISESVISDRLRIAKYIGGTTVIVTVLTMIAPAVIERFIK